MHRSPTELINLYWDEVWNNGNLELVREICADPIVRIDPNEVTSLSHDDQIARIGSQRSREPFFTHEVLTADETHVSSVWNMHVRKGGTRELCGIEVFRVTDGRLSHCWNSGYLDGQWGREGTTSRPKAEPPKVLASLDAIDRDWVQNVLCGSDPEAPRVGILTGLDRIGHGTLSETARVSYTYNADPKDWPTSLFCKFDRRSPEIAAANARVGFYEREIEAYRFLQNHPDIAAPRVYFAGSDPSSSITNIVLEDLSFRTTPGNQIRGCSVEEADAVVHALSRLHAKFLNADPGAWLLDRRTLTEIMHESYRVGASAIREFLGDRLTDAEYQTIAHLDGHYQQWARMPLDQTTFLHGDPRVDNVLFENTAGGIKAWLIDWQMAATGSPQFDLAYFITGSVTIEDRRANEKRWVAQHSAALALVDPSYDQTRAELAYRAQTVSQLSATVAAARTIERSEHGADLLVALAQRNCAAVNDWDAFGAIRELTH